MDEKQAPEATEPEPENKLQAAVKHLYNALNELLDATVVPESPAMTFLHLQIAYQQLYVLGQAGEILIERACQDMPAEEQLAGIAALRREMQPEIALLHAKTDEAVEQAPKA